MPVSTCSPVFLKCAAINADVLVSLFPIQDVDGYPSRQAITCALIFSAAALSLHYIFHLCMGEQ
jgi:hypothetical protein